MDEESPTCTNQSKFGFCRCPMPVGVGPILINEQDTYYPKAGMLRAGGTSLLDVRSLARKSWGLHFCRDVLQSKDAEAVQIALGVRWGSVSVHYTKRIKQHPRLIWCTLTSLDMHPSMMSLYSVWRIQAWIRRTLETRRQAKRLAFAMGLHTRLGRESAVLGLHADPLGLILAAWS